MSILTSSEMFFNIKKPPIYNPRKNYFEQSKEVLDFYEEEKSKIINGVYIGGFFVHPWLYFHLNFFKTPIPTIDENGRMREEIMNPPLDDNFMYTAESYEQAENENKGLCVFGSRGYSKALKNDEKLLYSDGWREIGDAKVGDEIYGADGKFTNIIGVYPQGVVDLYEVELVDGRKIVCCDEHLWVVYDQCSSKHVIDTNEIRGRISKSDTFYIPTSRPTESRLIRTVVQILNITKVDAGEATCIRVDNKDKLFITTDYVVTHNSTHITSLVSWLNTTKSNGTTSITGGSDTDLKAISSLMETSFTNSHPAFFVPRLISNWDSEIVFGIKEKNQKKMIHSRIAITNANKGSDKDSEKGAGLSPVGAVFDEIGKYKSKKNLDSALPSYVTQHGAKLVHLLCGCVCAGTKVWTNDGVLINIEDLKPADGIIGFDGNRFTQEPIEWLKPPHEKPCVRLEIEGGNFLECSNDHPLLTINDGVAEAVLAEDLKKGDKVFYLNELDLFGKQNVKEARMLGLMIGDGNYSKGYTPHLSCSDEEIFNYVSQNYDCRVGKTFDTKEGNLYRNLHIRNFTKVLKDAGIHGQVKQAKRLPNNIHTYNKESVANLLAGYFDSDGNIKTNKKGKVSVALTSSSKELLTEVKFQLYKFGISCNIYKENRNKNEFNGKSFVYRLYISKSEDVIKFKNNIKLLCNYKQDRLNYVEWCPDNMYSSVEATYKVNHLKKGTKLDGVLMKNIRPLSVKSVTDIGVKPIYNLTAGKTNTYLANGFVTFNTGGNQELSQDAKDILADPVAHNLIMMNWDRLDRSVPEEAMTWNRSRKTSFSMFAPGQMSYRLDVPKVKQTFSKYLGIDNKDLENLEIMVTDWRAATTRIQEKNASLKKEKDRYKNQMYFPLEIADCFLTSSENPFPVTTIEKHIRYLEDRGIMGKSINIYRDGKEYKQEFSGKQRAEVSHTGGLADAPVLLFGAFPENETPPRGLYVSGLDGYKLDQSGTDSLGAFYVLKRRNQAPNEPCETIAASYAARPERMRDFHTTCEVMSDTWNAECLMESADMGFKQFLEAKGREYDVLAARISFNSLSSQKKNKTKSEFGLYPTAGNNTYRFNLLVDMTKEEHLHEIDDNGEQIFKLGVEYIDDIDLLKEMRDWFKGGNFDRIDAYSHALVHARELDKKNIQPENVNKKAKLNGKEAAKKRQLLGNNRYGMNRGSRF